MSARIKHAKPVKVLAVLVLMLMLGGCRQRTTGLMSGHGVQSPEPEVKQTVSLVNGSEEAGPAFSGGTEAKGNLEFEPGEDSARTEENPESSQREYDEQADVEIRSGSAERIESEGEGSGFFLVEDNALIAANRLDDSAEKSATVTAWVEESEWLSTEEAGVVADSALQYYTVLLNDRTSRLFECKKLYVYWETDSDYVTIHKTSREHEVILAAGAYDVASRLTEDRLRVDDGWIQRKNPDVIVKAVPEGILGGGVAFAGEAASALSSLLRRDQWDLLSAAEGSRIFLVSEEVLGNIHLETAAKLFLAAKMYPSLFEDISLSEAVNLLMEEAGSEVQGGIYFYADGEAL